MIQKFKQIKEIIQLVYKLKNDFETQEEHILHLLQTENNLKKQFEESEHKIQDLLEREEWTRERFQEEDDKIQGLLEREEWIRERFQEEDDKIQGLLEREKWTRERFQEEDDKIQGLLEREEWTRKRFKETDDKIQGLLEREEWTRQQFEKFRSQINEMKTSKIVKEKSFYEKMTYSQSGEDAIILYILNFMGILWEDISYLDLGANHPIKMNNTYSLYQRGARGVLVEANPELIPELQNIRKDDIILNNVISNEAGKMKFYVMSGDGLSTISYEEACLACERNKEISIKKIYDIEAITLEQILKTYFVKAPTVLSIDLEGIEKQILETFDFRHYRPLIIILEDIPYYPYLVIDEREHKVADIMKKNGYIEYAFTGINVIFIDKEQVNKFNNYIIEKQKDNNS